MSDLLQDVLPYVAPVLVGLVSSGVASSLLSTRRLRKDIAELQGLLGAALSDESKTLLLEDVDRKVVRLSSLTRYPPLVGSDIVRLLAILMAVSVAGFVSTLMTPSAPKLAPPEAYLAIAVPTTLIATWSWFALLSVGGRDNLIASTSWMGETP